MNSNDIFHDLFVLELASNHEGKLERGLRIIEEFAPVVRFSNVKAAIKLQIRDTDRFIHKDFRNSDDRYIKRVLATKLSLDEYATLVQSIKSHGLIPMATPFDEASVEMCSHLDLPIIKIASSDIADFVLIEAIAKLKKPTIVSTGGSSLIDLDNIVKFFRNRNIPLALNHCVSIYPSDDHDLEMNQIDFLKDRYPDHVIGFSTHEAHLGSHSMLISYAKGARTWECHIDIDSDGKQSAAYNHTPKDLEAWFYAYRRAVTMCGAPGSSKRIPPKHETDYLHKLVRGVYARRDLTEGHELEESDIYLSIPLQAEQICCRTFYSGEKLKRSVKKDAPIMASDI